MNKITIRKCKNKLEKLQVIYLIDHLIGKINENNPRKTPIKNIYVVCLDSKIIGGGIISCKNELKYDDYCWVIDYIDSEENLDKTGYIEFIVVDSSYQAKGVGDLLLKKLIDVLHKKQCDYIYAYIWAQSPGNASEKVFLKNNFKKQKIIHNAWESDFEFRCAKCKDNLCSCDCIIMLLKEGLT